MSSDCGRKLQPRHRKNIQTLYQKKKIRKGEFVSGKGLNCVISYSSTVCFYHKISYCRVVWKTLNSSITVWFNSTFHWLHSISCCSVWSKWKLADSLDLLTHTASFSCSNVEGFISADCDVSCVCTDSPSLTGLVWPRSHKAPSHRQILTSHYSCRHTKNKCSLCLSNLWLFLCVSFSFEIWEIMVLDLFIHNK